MFKRLGLAALAAGTLLAAGCNDGPTSIAIPTPRPFVVQNLRQPITINVAGGTVTLSRAQLITAPPQLVVEGSFSNLTSAPAAPDPFLEDVDVLPTAAQIRQTFPETGQNPNDLVGPTRLFLNITQTSEAPFSGRFSGILDFRGTAADTNINAVTSGHFYLNFTTEGNTSASAGRIQIVVSD